MIIVASSWQFILQLHICYWCVYLALNIIVSMTQTKTKHQMSSCSVLYVVKSSRERDPVEKIWVQIKCLKTVYFVRVEWPHSAICLGDTHIKRELYKMNAI